MALACMATAQAKTITLDSSSYTNPASWVYVWDPSVSDWAVFTKLDDTYGTFPGYTPAENDPAYVGYTFKMIDGVQTLISTDKVMTVNAPKWIGSKGVYLGSNVTLTGNDNGLKSGASIDFADIATSQLEYTGRLWKQGDVTITGSLTLSADSFEHTFFSVSQMEQMSGVWDFSGFVVTDAQGNALTYTTDAEKIGKAGYFWVEETAFSQGAAYSATLVAKSIPEPATATLSLLALAGLAARRRRK